MAAGYRDILRSSGFRALLSAQFLGAFNDNAFRAMVYLFALSVAVGRRGGWHLSIVNLVFILPFLLFSGYAGYLADIFSKRSVFIVFKCFEIIAVGLGLFAFLSGRVELILGVLFLMGLKATYSSPAKYGIVPETFPYRDFSRVNGLLEAVSLIAIILGTAAGSFLFVVWEGRFALSCLILMLAAATGAIASIGISKVAASGSKKHFRVNPFAEILSGLGRIYRDRPLRLTVEGIAYFWFLGALMEMAVLTLSIDALGLSDAMTALILASLAAGAGAGALCAGRLSGDKVELGLVPLGSIGMGLFSILLSYSAPSFAKSALALFLLGFSGGLFIVPLNAFLQHRSARDELGRVIATSNFLSSVGIVLAAFSFWTLGDIVQMPAGRIILLFGLLTLVANAYVLKVLPDFFIRFVFWMLTNTVYSLRAAGLEHVPERGPALLVSNHVTQIDALLIGACVQRFIRFMMVHTFYETRLLNRFFHLMKAIPVARHSKDVVRSLEAAREELLKGHVVCIFAEGMISRTGNLLPFKRGFERIVEGLDVPVIPVHLDRAWGSIFSLKGGRFLWKWPERLPYPVTVSFGTPLPSAVKAWEVREAVMELGSNAVELRRRPDDLLHLRFVKAARKRWSKFCMADTTGKRLSYGGALVGSILLARCIRKAWPRDPMIGVMLPATVGGALVNIAVLLGGKVPVNLNFTAGAEAVGSAIRQCNISAIITSRLFLSRAKVEEMEGMVFLEDMTKGFTKLQRLSALLTALVFPAALNPIILRSNKSPRDLAAVIFTSGSTGVPKGVMLSHHNILSNIESFTQILNVTGSDRVMGVLPFFHSFGFTGTIWFPVISGCGVVYHPSPADAETIGKTIARYRATILISTPTFYAQYARRCTPEELSTLRYAIAGAEKLDGKVACAFREKYGIDILEGYGATEMSPVVSVNVPDFEYWHIRQTGNKPGTVGHPVPGVVAVVVDPATGERLPHGREGLLLLKGPNMMMGYLDNPQKTAEALRNGWYVTGDIASIDEDGFIRITDRVSRFSKIGGEMVPHIRIEEAVSGIIAGFDCVVASVPDERKGERLVLFHARKDLSPAELWERLCGTGLPRLWIPKQENIHYIEAIPITGTGKVDHRRVRAIAVELSGAAFEKAPVISVTP